MDSSFTPPASTGPAFAPTAAAPAPVAAPAQKTTKPDVAGFITASRAKGVPDAQIYSYLQTKGYVGQAKTPASAAPEPQSDPFNPLTVTKPASTATPTDTIKTQAAGGADQINEGITDIGKGAPGKNPIVAGAEDALKVGSGVASVVTAPAAPLFRPLSEIMQGIGNKIGDIPAVQKFANSPAGEVTSRVAEDVSNAGNIAGTIAGTEGAVEKGPAIVKAAQDVGQKADAAFTSTVQKAKAATAPAEGPNPAVVDNYYKAIKPTVGGKTSIAQRNGYDSNVHSAVQSIIANKDNLKLTDANGEEKVGQTPASPMEFAHAIDQTKSGIFTQYDALAKAAGKGGATIDTGPIAQSLDKVVNNEAFQISHPEAVAYAKSMQQRLSTGDGGFKQLDPETTQEVIKNYNSSLEAFYRNPSYDSASKAAIDANLVQQMREQIGKTIEGATGENYAALKKQYGALSAIEKDVNKRATVLARQTGGGLADYASVFSGGDMVHGILSLNPALFAKGAAQAGLTKYLQYLKSPDRAIKNMFDAAQRSPSPSLTSKVVGAIDEKPSMGMSTRADTSPNTTPESIAKNMDDGDFHILTDYLQHSHDLDAHMRADPIINAMGIGRLSTAQQTRFIKESLSTYEANTTQTVKADELNKPPLRAPN